MGKSASKVSLERAAAAAAAAASAVAKLSTHATNHAPDARSPMGDSTRGEQRILRAGVRGDARREMVERKAQAAADGGEGGREKVAGGGDVGGLRRATAAAR